MVTSFTVIEFAQADYTNVGQFIQIRADRELWARYVPAKFEKPTLVISNGLTYDTENWNAFTAELDSLIREGFGVLRTDMMGQGQTLLKYAPAFYEIPIADQVQDLSDLVGALKVKGPLVLLGLSYGGGLSLAYAATFPNQVSQLILMAPYTEPVRELDAWIKTQIRITRTAFPLNPASDEQLYEFFLRQLVTLTFPSAEPSILSNPFKLEAVYRLSNGIRKFNAFDIMNRLPASNRNGFIHLMTGTLDTTVPTATSNDFWREVPQALRGSRIDFSDTQHKLPEEIPALAAKWVSLILHNDPRVSGGREFQGLRDQKKAISRDHSVVVELGK